MSCAKPVMAILRSAEHDIQSYGAIFCVTHMILTVPLCALHYMILTFPLCALHYMILTVPLCALHYMILTVPLCALHYMILADPLLRTALHDPGSSIMCTALHDPDSSIMRTALHYMNLTVPLCALQHDMPAPFRALHCTIDMSLTGRHVCAAVPNLLAVTMDIERNTADVRQEQLLLLDL